LVTIQIYVEYSNIKNDSWKNVEFSKNNSRAILKFLGFLRNYLHFFLKIFLKITPGVPQENREEKRNPKIPLLVLH